MSGKRIFITGGATGLGRSIAMRYARDGWRVAIGDLNEGRGLATQEELASISPGALFFRCDVRVEDDLRAVAGKLVGSWDGVDVVVNNAGVAQGGAIEDVTLDNWQWILDVNLLGVVRGCRVFTPIFKRQSSGYFVNISSLAGLANAPLMSSYNATKSAVISLSETLDYELHGFGIGVTVVCPAFFKTNLGESFRTTDESLRTVMDKMSARSAINADDIADEIFHAVRRRRFYVISHTEGRWLWFFKRHLPRPIYTALMRSQMARLQAGRPAGV